MRESPINALRNEYDGIAQRLDAAGTHGERDAVKAEIIHFFKQVDTLLGDVGQLKEDIRVLVDKYKQLQAASSAEAAAPDFTGVRPAVKADHIGASTFIEKGWSLISLGDSRRSEAGAAEGAPALAGTIRRRSRCSAGRRCCRRSTTTRCRPSRRC